MVARFRALRVSSSYALFIESGRSLATIAIIIVFRLNAIHLRNDKLVANDFPIASNGVFRFEFDEINRRHGYLAFQLEIDKWKIIIFAAACVLY